MKPHRTYTLCRNLTFALFPALLTVFTCGDVVFFVVALLSFGAAVALAFVFPVRQDEPLERSAKLFFGFFGGAGLLMLSGFLLVIGIVCVDAMTSGQVEAEYATYSELAGERIALALHADAMISPEAGRIRFSGFGGGVMRGLGRHAEFSCKVAETDFVKLASSKGYSLETNRFVNANAQQNPNRTPWFDACWCELPLPVSFLSYTFVKGNGGGIRLLFDRESETLYGRYSSN